MTNLTSEQYRDVLKHVEGTDKIPTVQHLLRKAVETFFLNFGDYPEFAGVGPGKLGIFGENTAYSGGLALSLATPMVTMIVGRRSKGPRFTVVTSADVGKPHKVSFSFSKNRPLDPGCPFWLNHVKGVIDSYKGEVVPPFEAAIESSIPIGSGMGSSSALQVAIYSFLEVLQGVKSEAIEKAQACQEGEKNFALREVGLFDRLTTTTAWDRHLMLIDLENNDIQGLPVKKKNLAFVFIDPHFPNLLEDDYTEDKEYFDNACEILKVDTLRNCTEDDVNNLDVVVQKKIDDYNEKVQRESRVSKMDEEKDEADVEETEEPRKKNFERKKKFDNPKKLKFSTSNVQETNKKTEATNKRISNPNGAEVKIKRKSAEPEKGERNDSTLGSNTKKPEVEEIEEMEINGEEEDESELKTAEFYNNMMAKVKLYLTEMQNISKAVEAWKSNNFHDFGKIMNESHELLKSIYNFQVPLLDFLVQTSYEVEGVLGSRMIGKKSGGGGVITLIEKENIPYYCKYVSEKFKENEKELKEKCSSILYDLLMEKVKNYNRKISEESEQSLASSIYQGPKKPKRSCLKRIDSSSWCKRTCAQYADNIIEFINSCAENNTNASDKNAYLRKLFFEDMQLNLLRKEELCEEMKPKRCGTWTRHPNLVSEKAIKYQEKLPKEKRPVSVQERSRTSSNKVSLADEVIFKKINKGTSIELGRGDKKKNSLEEENGKRYSRSRNGNNSKRSVFERNSKKKSSLEENGKRRVGAADPSAASELSVSNNFELSIMGSLEKIEKQADPTFYVISPFAGAKMMFVTKTDILRSLYANPIPHPKTLLRSALKIFKADYGNKPTAIGIAPGTLTLFGEFMEFQLGYIICMALTMVTVMVGGKNDSVNFSVKTTSDQIEHPNEMIYPIPCVRPLEIESRSWANFIMGTVNEFKGHVPGFNAVISSSLPIQMGLNSCAALQACTFTFLENLTGKCSPDLFEKADLCGKSEYEFHPQPSEMVTKCSSIKFFPTFLCKEGHLMFINCKRYKISQYFFDHPSYVFLIATCKRITSNVTVESLDERLKKCGEALEILKRNSLLSIDIKHLKCLEKKEASAEIFKRIKYVISEHERTIEAVKAIKNEDYARVGLLMNQSHASLRDDYEISCPEIELIIKLAREVDGVLGAKMLGKGLTSTVIILAKITAADDCIRYVRKNYRPKTDKPQFYITKPSRGAFTMSPDNVYVIP